MSDWHWTSNNPDVIPAEHDTWTETVMRSQTQSHEGPCCLDLCLLTSTVLWKKKKSNAFLHLKKSTGSCEDTHFLLKVYMHLLNRRLYVNLQLNKIST